MSVALFPAPASDAFSDYRPSKNAHADFLSSAPGGSSLSPDREGVRRVKLSIKPRASESTQKELQVLLSSIAPLLSGSRTAQSFHHLSATCHKLVLPPHSLGPTIYTRIHEELEKSIAALAREWRGVIMTREAGWLGRLVGGWRAWEARVKLLSSVFVYLDGVYSVDSNGIASIRHLAIATFRKGIWENELLFQKTRDDFLLWANNERDAGQPNTDLRDTIAALAALAKLLPAFPSLLEPYLHQTDEFYHDRAERLAGEVESGTMSPTRYVEWVLEKVVEERERAEACLDAEVGKKAIEVVRAEAGEKMSKRVVRRALDEAMDNADAQALSRLYQFSVDVHVFKELVLSLEQHIETRLRTLISDPANDPQMIEGTLKLKRFADSAITGLFTPSPTPPELTVSEPEKGPDGETKVDEARKLRSLERARQLELQDSVRNGFKSGMGSRQNAPAEWIAKHLDAAMRKGQGAGTEAEFNGLLDEIIALIGFTKDKDVFKAFYSSQLAKRLLLNKSASDDMERNMIVKLQKEMGEEFTSGDVMMKDLQLSENLVKSYQTHLAKTSDAETLPSATSLTANVLTESAWPAYPLLKDGWNFTLPPQLQSSIDAFSGWYSTQHKNRQLSWRWQLATVTLSARFQSGKYEVGVSLFQAVVLMLFNEEDSLDFTEIKARSGIESSELVRTLQSLSMGRKGTRVLLKKPPGKEVKPTDVFAFNKAFTSERIKFRINQIQQDMSAEESRKTNEQVAIDRVSVLEATIVRIMKARKKMTLQLLIDAVVTDVNKRFPPDVKEIKKRVESLIEREFLMRDEEDRNLLHYLA